MYPEALWGRELSGGGIREAAGEHRLAREPPYLYPPPLQQPIMPGQRGPATQHPVLLLVLIFALTGGWRLAQVQTPSPGRQTGSAGQDWGLPRSQLPAWALPGMAACGLRLAWGPTPLRNLTKGLPGQDWELRYSQVMPMALPGTAVYGLRLARGTTPSRTLQMV